MEKVKKQTENNTKFGKFFFSDMADDERFEFEKEFASKPELLDEMRAFEADLIEKYVRNWMDHDERSKFETQFLNTKKRRQKVEFSRQLITELSSPTSREVEPESFWSKFGSWFQTPKFAFASAFSILILVFGGWFIYRAFDTGTTEVGRNTDRANVELSNARTNANIENARVNADLKVNADPKTNTDVLPTPSPTSAPPKVPETTTPTPKVAPNPVLALFAGTLRSDGRLNELDLPKNSNGATFQLNLKAADYKHFQANVTDGNGNVVFRSGILRPQRSTLNLVVPAKNLPKGDYRINLYGKNVAGENESAADFQFRVN